MTIWMLPVILLALCGAWWLFGKLEEEYQESLACEQVTDKMIQEALDLWNR
jgi:hypothetical protein